MGRNFNFKSIRRLSVVCAGVAGLISFLVILGWHFENQTLMTVLPGYVSMKFNTAVAILAVSISHIAATFSTSNRKLVYVAHAMMGLAVVIAVLSIVQDLFHLNLGVDELIYSDPAKRFDSFPPGRPAPITASSLVLIGLSYFLVIVVQYPHYRMAQVILLIVGLISFQALVAYGLGIHTSFGTGLHSRIPIHSAIAFILITLAFLLSTAFHGFMKILLAKTKTAQSIRILLLSVIVLPPLLIYLDRTGQRFGLFDADFGILLKIIFSTAFFVTVIWRTALNNHNSERSIRRSNRRLAIKELERQRLSLEKQMNEAFKRTEERLRAIFANAASGIIICDEKHDIAHWNQAAETMLGWEEAKIVGQNLFTVLTGSTSIYNEAEVASVELTAVNKKNLRHFPVKISASTIELRDEKMYVVFIDDISISKRSEEDLLIARQKALDKSRFKSEFLANISHEIRTPLNGIIGMSALLSKTSLDEKQRNFMRTIDLSSKSLLSLINQILDISKIESGNLSIEHVPFELNTMLNSTLSIVSFAAEQKGLNIEIKIDPGVPKTLIGDSLRLQQVLLNLINNAIKFSDQGIITVKVSKTTDETSPTPRFLFEVIDQGIGIESSVKEKLFKAFSQGDGSTSRKYGGTGLGLAISKQLVELMSGYIEVESSPHAGSRFYFELPLEISHIRPQANSQKTESTDVVSGKVLIVEDIKVNQQIVIEMLKLIGCRPVAVSSGPEALELLRKENFDLILMDIQIPEMEGYEVSRRIRGGEAGDYHLQTPIIAVTANAFSGEYEKCINAGMNDFIPKPVEIAEFTRKITKWLSRGQKVLNPETLAALVGLAQDRSYDLLGQLVELFCKETPPLIEELKSLVNKGDLKAASRIAHAIKSSSGSLGAHRLRELSEWIERSPSGAEKENVNFVVNALEREYQLAVKELHEQRMA